MRFWKKLWVLFSVIWVVVASLQVFTLVAFSPDEQEKIFRPIVAGVAVPAVLYLLGLVYEKLKPKV